MHTAIWGTLHVSVFCVPWTMGEWIDEHAHKYEHTAQMVFFWKKSGRHRVNDCTNMHCVAYQIMLHNGNFLCLFRSCLCNSPTSIGRGGDDTRMPGTLPAPFAGTCVWKLRSIPYCPEVPCCDCSRSLPCVQVPSCLGVLQIQGRVLPYLARHQSAL